jgi:tetratricopeptide (TPR) repeat protein
MVCADNTLHANQVLYYKLDNKWKVSDFGITCLVTSDEAFPTVHSRGTTGYRAPELLLESPTYTKKVDSWAMGCILGELSGIPRSFQTDFALGDWYTRGEELTFPERFNTDIMAYNHLTELVRSTMHRDPSQRPGAGELEQLFKAYTWMLECHGGQQLFQGSVFLSLTSFWRNNVANQCNDKETLLFRLAKGCEAQSRYDLSLPFLEALLEFSPANADYYQRLSNAMQQVDLDAAIETVRRLVEKAPYKEKFRSQLTNICLKKGGIREACRMWEQLVRKEPGSEPFSREYASTLADHHLEQGDWDGAAKFLSYLLMELPETKSHRRRLHIACVNRKDLDKELAIWKSLVDVHPSSEGLVAYLKHATSKLTNANDKIQIWSTLSASHPSGSFVFVQQLSAACKELGDERETVNIWMDLVNKWLGRGHYTGRLLHYLRDALSLMGDTNEAVKVWTRLADAHPDDRGLQSELASAKKAQENSLRFQDSLRAILKLDD